MFLAACCAPPRDSRVGAGNVFEAPADDDGTAAGDGEHGCPSARLEDAPQVVGGDRPSGAEALSEQADIGEELRKPAGEAERLAAAISLGLDNSEIAKYL